MDDEAAIREKARSGVLVVSHGALSLVHGLMLIRSYRSITQTICRNQKVGGVLTQKMRAVLSPGLR